MAGLSLVTLVMVVISTVRLAKLTKKKCYIISFQLCIHYTVFVQTLALLVYFTVFDDFVLHTAYEYAKLATFIIVGFFFTLSAHRFRLLPECISKRAVIAGFIFFFLFVTCESFLVWKIGDNCSNVGRLVFAAAQFVFAGFFGMVSFLILRTVKRGPSHRKTVSQSFMIRHTRPLTIVLIIYTWTSTVNVGLQIFLYMVTKDGESCHSVVQRQPEQIKISYPIFKQIDLLVPLWAILWYFYITRKKEVKLAAPVNLLDSAFENPAPVHSEKAFIKSTKPVIKSATSQFTGYSTSLMRNSTEGVRNSGEGVRNTIDYNVSINS